ncbi:cytochrome c oxidase subunit II (mitochondrion) [Galendromus occidentalis]|uniref:Cytochrome c oxidase subunit 2 n=1 Tax=Galendromus occidentalis TaxID=34638 RepID=A3RE62_9ACAR|nr:cytochrome c oxidase subunit II [Galendromus occidentalis]YP_001096012.1 cytochrome c oxidase subunit II [Galendromus occidentalis]ABN45836.1 cytochrome oxidase subunit 2 [Galendromus occidentalis]ABN45847.1 cytochrome oxidase subunit 2 [Galendromus occidentalis]
MSHWNSMYFQNANSPIMEQLLFFHDHSMIVISSIISFLLINLLSMMYLNSVNLNLNENQTLELIWTLMPMLLLIFIALPSLRLLYLMEETFSPNLTMKIIGHQWYWSYEYSDFNCSFDSFMENSKEKFRLIETDNKIYIPMNTFTRLLITSADVIHSWTIQSMGVKTDAIPGRLNQINLYPSRPGMFYGQCSEICGANHSFMPICLKISNMNNFINFIKSL